jgi:stage IV sporulation protein FB
MVRIRDIMSARIVSLRASASLEDAARALVANEIGGAPVVDDDGRVLGFLARADLADPERRANALERSGPSPSVADLMLPALAVLRDSEPAIEAARMMVREHLHRVLVTDEVGRLVGIVTPTDVLRAALP